MQQRVRLIVSVILLLLCITPQQQQQQQNLFVTAIRTRITWINGIAYNIEHMKEEQLFISRHFGNEPVVFCHNPTAMVDETDVKGYIADLTQAGQQKVLGRITNEVQELILHLKQAVAAVGKNGYVIHIAHSQGALITYLAAMQSISNNNVNKIESNNNNNNNIVNQNNINTTNITTTTTSLNNNNNNNILTVEEMERIEVIAFGGAAAIRKTATTPFKRCMNYYSVNDPLLYIVPEAAQALRTGFYVGNTGNNDEFCFLAPRSGDPLVDHSLNGPTYSQALQWEGIRYQQLYLHPIYRFSKSIIILLQLVFRIISERLHNIIKVLLRPILLWCYLIWNITMHVRDNIIQFYLQHIQVRLVLLIMILQECYNRIIYGPSKERYVPLDTKSTTTSSSIIPPSQS
jgi:hypothetical protein